MALKPYEYGASLGRVLLVARLDAVACLQMLAGTAFIGFAVKAAIADFRAGVLPFGDVIGMALAGAGLAALDSAPKLAEHLGLAVAIAGIGHALWWGLRGVAGQVYFGRGDWNYMAAAALGLGGFGIWLAAALGLAAALVASAMGYPRSSHYGIGNVVLGPYLAGGIVAAIVLGAWI